MKSMGSRLFASLGLMMFLGLIGIIVSLRTKTPQFHNHGNIPRTVSDKDRSGNRTERGRIKPYAKTHYYDPKIAKTAHGKSLAWELQPFAPTPQEFQMIAGFEDGLRRLNNETSEESYTSPEGHAEWRARVADLTAELKANLGEERYERYETVLGHGSRYSQAWRLIHVNELAVERTDELLDLAEAYNQETQGRRLDGSRLKSNDAWQWPAEEELESIRQAYRETLETRFGPELLQDLLALPHLDLFEGLQEGAEGQYPSPWGDADTRHRLEENYHITFELADPVAGQPPLMEHLRQSESQYSGMLRAETDE